MVLDARRALLILLADYFATGAFKDHACRPQQREYLREILNPLDEGDIVITLNWDTTVEMTLAEDGRWFAKDGYGLRHQRIRPRPGLTASGFRGMNFKSKVKVLKLHGGIGWKVQRYVLDRVYLMNRILQYMPTTVRGKELHFIEYSTDVARVETLDNLIEVPSYLKQIGRTPDLEDVWRQAWTALRRADNIEIWGYGLPESDGAVRLILSCLRSRLLRRTVKVAVHDPSGHARERWSRFLGQHAVVDERKL